MDTSVGNLRWENIDGEIEARIDYNVPVAKPLTPSESEIVWMMDRYLNRRMNFNLLDFERRQFSMDQRKIL